jgi:hypothetical protein
MMVLVQDMYSTRPDIPNIGISEPLLKASISASYVYKIIGKVAGFQ